MATGRRAALMQKLGKAKTSGVGNNFKDGRYRLVIKSMGFQEGHKGMRYQVEFVVANSVKVPVVSVKTGEALNIEPNPVGATVDWLCTDLDKDDKPGAGNLKRFILTLVGALDASDEDYLDTLAELSDTTPDAEPLPVNERQQPGRGMVIDMETVRIETKINKKEIVVCKFSHVPKSQYDKHAMIHWMDQVAAFAAAQAKLPAGAGAQAA